VKPPLENSPSNSTSLAQPGEVEVRPSPHVAQNSLETSPDVVINQEIGQEVDLPPPPYQAPGYYCEPSSSLSMYLTQRLELTVHYLQHNIVPIPPKPKLTTRRVQ
jgi:hypothetical protein